MVLECCELCGTHSTKFTCQTCINSGNFWIDKAQFSFSGKKKIASNLRSEKDELRKILSTCYKSSLSYKESIKKSLVSENSEKEAEIRRLRLRTTQLEDEVCSLREKTLQREKDLLARRAKLETFREDIKATEGSCVRGQEKVAEVKGLLQVTCRSVLRDLNTIFEIAPESVLGIRLRECGSIRGYVRQIRVDEEGTAEDTSVALSFLIQFTGVLARTLSVHLPFPELTPRLALPRRLLSAALQQLNCNILYLCLSQHVHPDLLVPRRFLSNLRQLLENEETCLYREFDCCLEQGEEEEEEEEVSSSESEEGEWERLGAPENMSPDTSIHRRPSYIGSLIWKT